MTDGKRQVVFNNLERALSPDANNLQLSLTGDRVSALSNMVGAINGSVGGIQADVLVDQDPSPIPHKILGGAMVVLDGNTHLSVQPGVFAMYAPGFDAFNDFVIIRDNGVLAGDLVTLPFVAQGADVWMIVEARVNPVPVEVTAPRDIFDPVTLTFSSSVVVKSRSYVMEYRIRYEAPGTVVPAPDPAWCPLAIGRVLVANLSFANTVFYDVRPSKVYEATGDDMSFDMAAQMASPDIAPRSSIHPLSVRSRGFGGMKTPSKMIATTSVNEAGFVPTNGSIYNTYRCFPHGYPRWAVYVAETVNVGDRNPALRKPSTQHGLLINSFLGAAGFSGPPALRLVNLSNIGVSGSHPGYVCGFAARNADGTQTRFLISPGELTNDYVMPIGDAVSSASADRSSGSATYFGVPCSISSVVFGPSANTIEFTMNCDVISHNFPNEATHVLMTMEVTLDTPTIVELINSRSVDYQPAGPGMTFQRPAITYMFSADGVGATWRVAMSAWVPTRFVPSSPVQAQWIVTLHIGTSPQPALGENCYVDGFRL